MRYSALAIPILDYCPCKKDLKKTKVHATTGREGPEKEQTYSSTLSLTSALDVGRWSMPPPRLLCSREGAQCTAPRPAWTDAENLAPTGIRSADPPARSKYL
jgi:hypothetical protein